LRARSPSVEGAWRGFRVGLKLIANSVAFGSGLATKIVRSLMTQFDISHLRKRAALARINDAEPPTIVS
jgi:hypothetical protein